MCAIAEAAYHILEHKLWVVPLELRDPPHAARSDHAPIWQIVQSLHGLPRDRQPLLRDKAVQRILPIQDSAQHAPVGKHGRDVLQAVHEHVDRAFKERDLELFRPQRLAPEEVKRLGLVFVAPGGYEGRGEGVCGEGGLERGQDDVSLSLGECRSPRCEDEGARCAGRRSSSSHGLWGVSKVRDGESCVPFLRRPNDCRGNDGTYWDCRVLESQAPHLPSFASGHSPSASSFTPDIGTCEERENVLDSRHGCVETAVEGESAECVV